MAFLDQVAHRKTEIAKARRDGNDEAHMGGRQAVERGLILIIAPTNGEVVFLVALEVRRLHRGPYKFAS